MSSTSIQLNNKNIIEDSTRSRQPLSLKSNIFKKNLILNINS